MLPRAATDATVNSPSNGRMRRGTLYVLVLVTAMIVATVGLAALASVRLEHRSVTEASDFAQARLHALSAIDLGLFTITADSNWRDNLPNGDWFTDVPVADGTLDLSGVDPNDGDLSDNPADHVLLVGVGGVGDACYKLRVELAPAGPPGMDSLGSAICTGERFMNYGTITASAVISANLNLGNWATINADVEAAGFVWNEGVINGTSTDGVDPKELPDATVFDEYVGAATPISISSLPWNDGEYRLRKNVLSPASNPFGGGTNPDGLYLIDCQGYDLRITKMRIVGTLILLNPGDEVYTKGGINWEPARSDYPALLVDGNFNFEHDEGLDEDDVEVNFNPPGTPYQGASDSDQDDTYPAVIKGLCYVSGWSEINGDADFEGVLLVGGRLTVNSQLSVTHDASIASNPPPGFERPSVPMAPVAGTWQRVVD